MVEIGFDLGARLRALREMHGLSQRELAKRAGVSNAIISLIEQNRNSPSVGSLKTRARRLADFAGRLLRRRGSRRGRRYSSAPRTSWNWPEARSPTGRSAAT